MAIEKVTTYDMEIVDKYSIQVRARNAYVEDGVEISASFHRHVIYPWDDWSSEPQTVQNFADALFTDEVKAEHAEAVLKSEPEQPD